MISRCLKPTPEVFLPVLVSIPSAKLGREHSTLSMGASQEEMNISHHLHHLVRDPQSIGMPSRHRSHRHSAALNLAQAVGLKS